MPCVDLDVKIRVQDSQMQLTSNWRFKYEFDVNRNCNGSIISHTIPARSK